MAANCFHNHCQCNYIIVLGIGVTWHSRMSNASKGCQISRVLSSYAGPGRRCINAMWQYQIGCLQSCDIHHSVFLLSKEVTVHDPFKKHGPGRVWTRRGGGGPFMWMVHFSEWEGGPFRSDRSLPVPKDCPQYIPKGNPTPASKLAFVIYYSLYPHNIHTICNNISSDIQHCPTTHPLVIKHGHGDSPI